MLPQPGTAAMTNHWVWPSAGMVAVRVVPAGFPSSTKLPLPDFANTVYSVAPVTGCHSNSVGEETLPPSGLTSVRVMLQLARVVKVLHVPETIGQFAVI